MAEMTEQAKRHLVLTMSLEVPAELPSDGLILQEAKEALEQIGVTVGPSYTAEVTYHTGGAQQ